MLKQFVSLLLVAFLFNLLLAGTTAAKTKENLRFTAKVKEKILKLGTGKETRIKVKLRDQTKLEGYLSAAAEENFTITDLKTGAATTVPYSQVKSAKGNNLSTGAKIAIGVGIAAAIIFVIWFYTVVYDD